MENLTKECVAVANYIIIRINEYNSDKKLLREKVLMSTRKLQKLMYFCDAEYMKRNNGITLFPDEYNAWPSGPVIDLVYDYYMQYNDCGMFPRTDLQSVELQEDAKSVIDEVLEKIRDIDSSDLITASCIENGPWHQVFVEEDKLHQQVVSKEEMYSFYKKRDIITGEQDLTLIKNKTE